MNLPPGWYAIAETCGLSMKKPNALRRFGKDLAVWRDLSGAWIAADDQCPHRGAKLSGGTVKDGCIVCPFHGFEFESGGSCRFVPELGGKAPGIKVPTVTLVEKHGLVWYPWRIEPVKNPEIPWFPNLSDDLSYARGAKTWKTHFGRCVENQLDYAHLPFVHRTTIGRGFDPKIAPEMTFTPESLKATFPGGLSGFEFRFPNIWTLYISPVMQEFLVFVPVDDETTLIIVRKYNGLTPLRWFNSIIARVMRPFSNYVLYQDKSVVENQRPKDPRDADHEILVGSDKAIKKFREWLRS